MNLATALSERPFEPEEAYRALDKWAQEHGRRSLLLLLHAAVPNILRPDLLNIIKLNFVPEARGDPTPDADVLFCQFVEPIGADFYRLHAEIRRQCLALLDGAFKSESTRRTVRVAKLMLAYIEQIEHQRLDPSIRRYTEVERWVALAFLEPGEAARRFAAALKHASESTEMVARLRFGGVAAALDVPLSGYQALLTYAEAVDRIAERDVERAHQLLSRLGEGTLSVSDVDLPPLGERLAPARGRRFSDQASALPRSASTPIFMTYARSDGARFAADLRHKLQRRGLSVWQDIVSLEGGRDWWSQIEEAIRSKELQHFLLIVTPAALESVTTRREIRLARQEGKTVSPIRGPGLIDLNMLPRWLGQIYDLDLPEHYTTLIRVLQDRSRQKRVAMMAPDPPADFVQRPAEFNALKKQLLDSKGDSVAITAALRGAGGYGKTTLAKALAHDPDVQDAYFDGILWVELGERPENLLAIISDLITRLTGSPPGLETINAAASALAEALGHRRILLIIDDAWGEMDLRPFLQGGPRTTRLITTRIDDILPAGTYQQLVDAMSDEEALKLLAWDLPPDQSSTQKLELDKLVRRLGGRPLRLNIVNRFLRDRVRAGRPLSEAIVGVNKRLDAEGPEAFLPPK
jgi:hypothetical protein